MQSQKHTSVSYSLSENWFMRCFILRMLLFRQVLDNIFKLRIWRLSCELVKERSHQNRNKINRKQSETKNVALYSNPQSPSSLVFFSLKRYTLKVMQVPNVRCDEFSNVISKLVHYDSKCALDLLLF